MGVSNETLDNIKRRRSVRTYLDMQIKDEELQAVLEAGLYAPYAGKPSCRFTVIQDKDLLIQLSNAAKEISRNSSLSHLKALGNDENFNCMYAAPALIIISNDKTSLAPEMCCAASAQNLLIAAQSLGLGACWIYFMLQAFLSPQGEYFLKQLKLPENYQPYISISLGHKHHEVTDIPDRDTSRIEYIR
jgi:nitroreductase